MLAKILKSLAVFLFLSSLCFADFQLVNDAGETTFESHATTPVIKGTTLPSVCAVGDRFFDTDATAGRNTYGCTATNTWTLQGDGNSGGAPAWGTITGTLSSQTDLNSALSGKAPSLGDDDNYVTDAEKVVIGNTSNTNTGDNTVASDLVCTNCIDDAEVTTNAGTALSADLEEEAHASEHQDTGADEIAVTAGMMDTGTSASSSTYWRGDNTWATPSGGAGDIVFVATPADTAINVTADATIVTRDVTGVTAGDQLIVDAEFLIMNNSTATRVCVITTDFDAAFDVEHSTGALAFSTTLWHPFRVHAMLNVRASNLAYASFVTEGQLAAGIASGTDTTMAATHLRAMGWGTATGDLTGTVTVALKVRSAATTATQTLYLLSLTIRKVTPT